MKDDFAIEKKIEVFKDKDGRLKFVVRSNQVATLDKEQRISHPTVNTDALANLLLSKS
ncbi:hypothetical protein Q2P89_002777 [Escherichia coli]|uniref:hypothetical protein n=1 Tax=Escherichia coli TaxID=562 RepID=UPI0015814526|nr:hypothetical protein [Escherichia coli]ELM8238435.1 hypothetical protein [Escherichia coli]ELM8270948.1 hypothetical protein [Escherichia coli]ELM8303666.1 hypothetical protein [Escherichia coli]ELM8308440.1 hypothetical protein [Escherichia coli]ELM8313164.1 hypothetical protein [Escherichia coli]